MPIGARVPIGIVRILLKLNELKLLSLSEDTIVRILLKLRGYPLKALGFFNWVVESQKFKHNAVTYNVILRVLGREDTIEKVWSMVKEMKSAGHDMDIDTYKKLSRQFRKCKMMKEAVELYELMMDSPYNKPSAQQCSSLLRQILIDPDLSLVFRVVKKYETMGNSISKSVYDGIHRSLISVEKFDEAEKFLVTMRNAGFEPDNITYSQAVFGLCEAKRLEEACEVLDEMEAKGCTPDINTWKILIEGHCTAGEVEKALTCFTKMLEKNCESDAEADSDILYLLVDGLCNKKKVDSAYNLVVKMVDKTKMRVMRPWPITYKQLIENLLGQAKLKESFNLLRLMRKHKFTPFPDPYFHDPFFHYISKYGTVNDAREFLKAIGASSSAYLHVFQSFFKEGRHSEAQDMLYMSPHHIQNHSDIVKLFGKLKRESASA